MAGRCIPAFISDAIDAASDAGETLVDKYNQTVEDDELEDGSKYVTLHVTSSFRHTVESVTSWKHNTMLSQYQ